MTHKTPLSFQKTRYIVHVDMDAFFASIEQRDNPKLLEKPVVVGADPKGGRGRGVVSTCSYAARKYGITSAMPISKAFRLCPFAVFLPVNYQRYSQVSEEIYDILYRFTPQLEMASIDEAFLDISGSFHQYHTARALCEHIKASIRGETRLTASLGLAPTRMAAKIASDLMKPDGFVEVPPEQLAEFLRPLAVDKIWGIGKQSKNILQEMGINTIGDLADTDVGILCERLGKNGEYFLKLAQGFDSSEVGAVDEVKSVSNEVTFDEDLKNQDALQAALMQLCEKVSSRLRQQNLKAKTFTLKVRLTGFHTFDRSRTVSTATNFSDELYAIIRRLFVNFDRAGKSVRLLGVKASHLLDSGFKDTLFTDGMKAQRKEQIHRAIDTINRKFGSQTIGRARAQSVRLKFLPQSDISID